MVGRTKRTLVSILTAASLLGGGGCATFSSSEYTHRDQATLGAAIVCQAADIGTTHYALNRGAEELNPILGKKPSLGKLIGFKAGIIVINYIVGELLPSQRTIQYGISAGMGCTAAGWNAYQIKKMRE